MFEVEGYLEKFDKGFGFLRDLKNNFNIDQSDVFVPANFIRRNRLDEGLFIQGVAEKSENKNKNLVLSRITTINGHKMDDVARLKSFKNYTTINPAEPFNLSLNEEDNLGKLLNLFTPIGRGQRGLIVSPPKAGKTTILQHIAQSISQNHPNTHIFVLLVDERPEEVTDFRRSIPNAFVLSSSSDERVANHLRITRLVMNSAIRSMEAGNDVVVLVDSLTRMGRAYNNKSANNGRTLSGGLSTNALDLPRRFFGAARNLENSGSLTIIATILVDTGSRMDEVIFQEFKGTGNMDLVLSRKAAEQRVWPAININESGTRKEHLLLSKPALNRAMKVRNIIGSMNEVEAMKYCFNLAQDKKI